VSLARDLLRQAEHLATKEPRRPKQASLRRAVSNLYYALFHHLVDADLGVVARTFLELQQARHAADYDLSRVYDRREVMELVRRCEVAFEAFGRVQGSPSADSYLLALLVHRQLRG
jgi:hypothetical protein